MPNPILARADALMSRRRQALDPDDVPVLTDVVNTDDCDDIPVLTDCETPAATEEPANCLPASQPAEALSPPDQQEEGSELLAATPSATDLARELAYRIEQRLLAELPKLIESTLRDYLAEQEMIADKQNRP